MIRRSVAVQLTLLPMLAVAAVAAVAAADPEPPLAPPGMTEQVLSPPGMTPTLDECRLDPDGAACDPYWTEADVVCTDRTDPDCATYTDVGGVIRGGFGHYFWVSGG